MAIVAATGPSLELSLPHLSKEINTIVVNDAYRAIPSAEVLYACDNRWWNVHNGCPDFKGEKWSSHGAAGKNVHNDKTEAQRKYNLKVVLGSEDPGLSLDPHVIHYGSNSGHQALNLAVLFGANPIILIGFDMQVNGKRHFFGDHPHGLSNTTNYKGFIAAFDRAAAKMPPGLEILNATPGSALTCFPRVDLADVLQRRL